jgi:predicted P-loop ATPase
VAEGGHGGRIDFVALAGALLQRAERLVPEWLRDGRRRGHEWVCAGLHGGKGESLSVNLTNGRWADFATDDRGSDLVSLYAAIHGLNNGQAARQLMQALGWQLPGDPAAAGHARPAGSTPAPAAVADDGAAAGGAGGDRTAPRRTMWRAVVPVPAHAPAPDFKHWHYAEPEDTWDYRLDGQLFGYVVRFRTSTGGKEVLPYTWCVDESDGRGTSRWHWKQWDQPRPLYVPAGRLCAAGSDPPLPVVLVEGEKCALAGHQVLGAEFDWVSWPGGAKAWDKAAWSWLAGRTVYLWPDCDAKRVALTRAEREAGVDPDTKPLLPAPRQPGLRAMVEIGAHLVRQHGCTVLLCPLPAPGEVADGWDVADALQQGWAAGDVRAFVRGASAFEPPAGDEGAPAAPPSSPGGGGDGGDDGTSTPSGAGAGKGRPAWKARLIVNGNGNATKDRENLVLALDGLPAEGVDGIPQAQGVIAFNELTNDVVKLQEAPWGTPAGAWAEVDDLLMGEWLVRQHRLPSTPRGTLEEAVRMVAYRHRFHPVRSFLQGLQWDGTPRLATWLRRACLQEDEWDDAAPLQRYLARVGTFFVMAMCARVMRPGVKFDYMLILEGAQGMRKSTLLRTLAGDYFADTGLVLGDKDSYQQLQGVWLYEIPELDAFSKADVMKIKAYVASQEDYFRASFDRRAAKYPRQVVFAGTTNEDHYLTDATGNRRFWPVRVTRLIDIDWVQQVRDQLLAEGMARLAAGRRMYPTPEEELELFVPQQQHRAVEGAIESAVARYLYPPENATGPNSDGELVNEISVVALLAKVGIGIEKLGPGRFHEKQASSALRRLGWTEARSSGPGRPRVYRRPKARPGGSLDSMDSPTTRGENTAGADDDCPF